MRTLSGRSILDKADPSRGPFLLIPRSPDLIAWERRSALDAIVLSVETDGSSVPFRCDPIQSGLDRVPIGLRYSRVISLQPYIRPDTINPGSSPLGRRFTSERLLKYTCDAFLRRRIRRPSNYKDQNDC